ncbi:MAG: hypothetical protein ACKV2V_13640 [Blastocatellia bacterium]
MDYKRAATVLLQADLTTDEIASEKFGVSPKTIRTWRRRLLSDTALFEKYREQQACVNSAWADRIPGALLEAMEAIRIIARRVQEDQQAWRNPEMLQNLAGAVKGLSEVEMAGKVVEARIQELQNESEMLREEPLSSWSN